jgi:hypothetical protein
MPPGPDPPPGTCPIAWQPEPLAPVFFGRREVTADDGAPTSMCVFFPSLDGAVDTAPLLEGCGAYPLVLFIHGHCAADTANFRRWFHLPAQLARSGYVVVVPEMAGIASGIHPSMADHPDLETLEAVTQWVATQWEHADVLDAGRIGVVGHSFGALIGARFGATAGATAFAGLSGVWQDWPTGPLPITLLDVPTLLVWGGILDFFTELPDSVWDELPPPKHRVVWTEGEHWDYLVGSTPPCSAGAGPCPAVGVASADLVTMFLGKYVPPEHALYLSDAIPDSLIPPALDLTPEQQFFAGGHLVGFDMVEGQAACAVSIDEDPWPFVANRRSRETHSRANPCSWVRMIAPSNRRFIRARPDGYRWCDFCFPDLADG